MVHDSRHLMFTIVGAINQACLGRTKPVLLTIGVWGLTNAHDSKVTLSGGATLCSRKFKWLSFVILRCKRLGLLTINDRRARLATWLRHWLNLLLHKNHPKPADIAPGQHSRNKSVGMSPPMQKVTNPTRPKTNFNTLSRAKTLTKATPTDWGGTWRTAWVLFGISGKCHNTRHNTWIFNSNVAFV